MEKVDCTKPIGYDILKENYKNVFTPFQPRRPILWKQVVIIQILRMVKSTQIL